MDPVLAPVGGARPACMPPQASLPMWSVMTWTIPGSDGKGGEGCGWFLNENLSNKQTRKFIWIFHDTQTHRWSTFRPLEALIDFYEPVHIKSPSLNTQNYLLWFNIFHLKAHLSGQGLGSFHPLNRHLFNIIDFITSVLSVSLRTWKKSKQRCTEESGDSFLITLTS